MTPNEHDALPADSSAPPAESPDTAPATRPPAASGRHSARTTAPGDDVAANDTSDWYAGIEDENIRRWAQAKGWKDPLAAVESNYNLERLIGQDRAGRTLVIPREDAPLEEQRAFRARLGVPESAEGYQLPIPEGATPEFAHTAAQWLHEAGVPAKSAEQLAARWNAHLAASEQASARAREVESAAQLEDLRAEWGSAFDANTEIARRAGLHFMPGMEDSERRARMNAIERAIGTGPFLRLMANVGRGLSEHMLVNSGHAGGGAYSPSDARARIAQLRGDRAWTASYIGGDTAKAAEMNRLHRIAFGGEGE